jgi:hypothetical protein
MKRVSRTFAVLACSAAMLSPVALTFSASASSRTAANSSSHSRTERCTITAVDRAALLDQLAQVRAQLGGARLTRAEKTALRAAIAELRTAALNANMSALVRAEKAALLAELKATLKTTTSVTERVAIRAQQDAIRAELRAARLTRVQRAAIQAEASALRTALRARPARAEAKLLRAQVATLKAQLHCRTAPTSAPSVAGF